MRLAVFVIAAALLLSVPPPASADYTGGGGIQTPVSGTGTGTGGQAVIHVPGASTAGGIQLTGTGSASVPAQSPWISFTCTYYDVGDGSANGHGSVVSDTSTLTPGTPVWSECVGVGAGGSIRQGGVVPWNPAAPAILTAQDLAQIALAELVLPTPGYSMAPAPDRQLTGLRTWLHIGNWRGQQASAGAAGITATVHARPLSSRWHFPDGTITCHDAGEVWTRTSDEEHAPDCSTVPVTATFTRQRTSDPASVDVTWRVWWTSNLGHNEPLGNVTRTATFAVTIEEYQVTTS